MTTQSDALPRCPFCGHTSIGIETYVTDGFYAFCRSCHACGPYVSKEKAIAAFTNPAHALAASRAKVERLRQAAANVAAMYQTDPLLTVDGLTDTEFLARINTLRAAIKATCRECDGTGQGEPSWDGEKYSPRDCVKCGGSDAV